MSWSVLHEKVILKGDCSLEVILPEIRTLSFSKEFGFLVQKIDSEQVHFPGYSTIQQSTSIYQAITSIHLSVC